jgi:hypothetical protein
MYKGSNLSNNGHQYCKILIQEGKYDIKIKKSCLKGRNVLSRGLEVSYGVYRGVKRNILQFIKKKKWLLRLKTWIFYN